MSFAHEMKFADMPLAVWEVDQQMRKLVSTNSKMKNAHYKACHITSAEKKNTKSNPPQKNSTKMVGSGLHSFRGCLALPLLHSRPGVSAAACWSSAHKGHLQPHRPSVLRRLRWTNKHRDGSRWRPTTRSTSTTGTWVMRQRFSLAILWRSRYWSQRWYLLWTVVGMYVELLTTGCLI